MKEKIISKTKYKVGTVIQDDNSEEVFEVLSCKKSGDKYNIEISKIRNNNRSNELFRQLEDALSNVKMHDKDLFMLLNILSTLEDSVNK